jgi:hypothetical protein
MMNRRGLTLVLLGAALALWLSSYGVVAQSSGTGYTLDWWTVDGGGGRAGVSPYTLDGTVGQPDAGPTLGGDGYELVGGFWSGGAAADWGYHIYLPLVVRNASDVKR